MTRDVTLAATQFACGWDVPANLDTAERLVREAAGRGAQIVLLQELFATPYFPITQDTRHFDLAGPAEGHPVIARFSRLAGGARGRASGELLRARRPGVLQLGRRSSTPTARSSASIARATSPTPAATRRSTTSRPATPASASGTPPSRASASASAGTSGSRSPPAAWRCRAPRCCCYPTAIGSDPPAPDDDSRDVWQLVQRGHAIANAMPLVASNRIGVEAAPGGEPSIRFYGSSFIASETGALLAEASRDREEVVAATVDLDAVRYRRETGASSATAGRSCTGRCSRSTARRLIR